MSIIEKTKKYIWIIVGMLLILVSLVQGNYLRRIGYFKTPEPYKILDEHTNIWHGLSIRRTGIPTAWSILPVYKEDAAKFGSSGGVAGLIIKSGEILPTFVNYREIQTPITSVFEEDLGNGMHHIPLVQPYLDHPPFGALVLSLGVPKTVNTFSDVSDYDLRKISIIIAIVTQILIVVVAYLLTESIFVAVASSFIYATVPSFLLMSRYSQLENILTPLMLVSLTILLFVKNKKLKFSNLTTILLLVIAGIVAGLCALTKLSGWITILIGAIVLFRWKFSKKQILSFIVPGFILGILYFIWGFYLSPKLFVDIFTYQGISRGFVGSINLLITMIKVNILNFPFDGWWIGGFLSLILLPKRKNMFPFTVSVLLILASALVLGGANYPWYFIPLIPFLCISIAMFFYELLTNPNLINWCITFLVFISSSLYWGYGVYFASKVEHNYQQPFTLYRLMFLLFMVVLTQVGNFKRHRLFNKYWKIFILILFATLILLNHHGFYYILDNWGSLPSLYTPGTF